MSLYNAFATDTDLERNGVAVEYGEDSKGNPITLYVARAGGANTQFLKQSEFALRPFKRALENVEGLDAVIGQRINDALIPVYARTVLLGWKNVEDRDGKPLDYSAENAEQLLKDLPALYADIQKVSGKHLAYRASVREADSGN